ncbi:MAG: hypothetical protein C0483_25075 [Pirellula sp.]|nr:hypothetical protein [Pirellula sp.]
MKDKLDDSISFFKTTAIGGVLFLLPFLVVVGLLVYVHRAVVAVHEVLKPWIPLDSATSFALLFAVALAALLAMCFAAGVAARRAIGVRFANTIEKQLMKVYPKYGIYKDMLAGKFGGADNVPSLRSVLVKRDGMLVPAFQADRLEGGLVVVYFPGAPDTWYGSIALVPPENVQAIPLAFNDALEICERLGRESAAQLQPIVASAVRSGG